jgi:hypothetical protein
MHMQYPVLPEVIPQVLANRHHPHQLPPINHIRVDKPPLRPIHPHSPASKRRRMPLRPTMYLIPFWHFFSRIRTSLMGEATRFVLNSKHA